MTDPFAAPVTTKTPADADPAALFDDKGEPDFSGWLNAQADAKKGKKVLPKGLAKTAAVGGVRPGIGAKVNSTGGVKKTVPLVAKAKVVKKEEKVEEDADADDWGDAW